jgi:hypothetical protein
MPTDVSLINPTIKVVDSNSTVTVKDNTGETTVLISNVDAPDIVISSPTVFEGASTLVNFGFIYPQSGEGTVISSTNVTGSNSPFIITMPTLSGVDDNVFQINNQGVVVLGSTVSGSTEPIPTEGGFYYHNGVFYLGTL